MISIPCFLLQRTDRCRRRLRRLAWANKGTCEARGPHGLHEASAPIEDGVVIVEEDHTLRTEPSQWSHEDPRWPAKCDRCEYIFAPDDVQMLVFDELYINPKDGCEYTTNDAPVGAMWFTDWYLPEWAGPDGHCLAVMTPGGEWIIDGLSSSGGRPWTRTGAVPYVTAHPSIHIVGRYHGWLIDGQLIEC